MQIQGTVSISEAYRVARAAPGWWWRPVVVLIGYAFIPVGVYGWWRRYYLSLRAGEGPDLPGFAPLTDLKLGLRPMANFFIWYLGWFALMLLVMGVVLLLAGVPAALLPALEQGDFDEVGRAAQTAIGALGIASIIGLLGAIVAWYLSMFLYMLAGVDIACRCFSGERWPALSPLQSIREVRRRPRAMLWLVIGHGLAISFVPLIGLLACVIGVYPVMLLCMNAGLVSLVQWDLGRSESA